MKKKKKKKTVKKEIGLLQPLPDDNGFTTQAKHNVKCHVDNIK